MQSAFKIKVSKIVRDDCSLLLKIKVSKIVRDVCSLLLKIKVYKIVRDVCSLLFKLKVSKIVGGVYKKHLMQHVCVTTTSRINAVRRDVKIQVLTN